MSTQIDQDGHPYLPEPDDSRYDDIQDELVKTFLHALVQAIREQFAVQKTDADRLSAPGLSGTKVYYVSDSSGGAVNRKLTFVDGILTLET